MCVKLTKVDFPYASVPARLVPVSPSQNPDPVGAESPLSNRQLRKREKNKSYQEETLQPATKSKRPKWTEEKERLLCHYWEKETLLYDGKHPDHRKSQLRADAYQRIASQLDMDGKYLICLT